MKRREYQVFCPFTLEEDIKYIKFNDMCESDIPTDTQQKRIE